MSQILNNRSSSNIIKLSDQVIDSSEYNAVESIYCGDNLIKDGNNLIQGVIMNEESKDKIIKLKAEVYDIIRQQEILAIQNNNLQELKMKKNQEIGLLESDIK